MSERDRVQNRIAAAWVNGGPAAVTPRGGNRYTVISRDGATRYTVAVRGSYGRPESYACDCPSGVHGGAMCWHRAAVWLLHASWTTLVEAA